MTRLHKLGRRAAIYTLAVIVAVSAISLALNGQSAPDITQISCIVVAILVCAGAIVLFSSKVSEKRLKSIIQNTALSVGSLVFTLLLIEAGARVYRLAHPLARSNEEYRRTQPVPYQKSPYFSQEFVTEMFKQPGGWVMPPNTILILPDDFDGKYFHVKDGKRATAGQPADFQHTVYVFGGSTVYCSEVPDVDTLPSQLQVLLNQKFGSAYRVENYGTTSVNSMQQLARLKTVPVKPGDIVIFYDGANDIFLALYSQEPQATLTATAQHAVENLPPLDRLVFDVYYKYHDLSAAVELFLYPYALRVPAQLTDTAKLERLTAGMKAQYETNIRGAYEYTKASGGTFYHFLQPEIFTLANHSHYEQSLIDNPYLVPPGSQIAFEHGYPALRAANSDLAGIGIPAFDLSAVLNPYRQQGEEFFLDQVHVNEVANRIIAQAIFDPVFGEQP